MRYDHRFGPTLLGLSLVAGAGVARAAEGEKGGETVPVSFAERPLTLPRMTLAPELGFTLSHADLGGIDLGTKVGLEIGARFGILDDLEVGAVVLPLVLSPDFAYENPRIEATFRLLEGRVELGARLRTTFVTQHNAGGAMVEAGMPVLVHLGAAARIDTGVFVSMGFRTGASVGGVYLGGETAVGLRVPFQLIYNVIPELHVGAQTGFGVANFSDTGRSAYVPLGFVAGYAIGNEKGALVDIDPYFTFPFFVGPGFSGDKVQSAVYQTGVTATLYLHL